MLRRGETYILTGKWHRSSFNLQTIWWKSLIVTYNSHMLLQSCHVVKEHLRLILLKHGHLNKSCVCTQVTPDVRGEKNTCWRENRKALHAIRTLFNESESLKLLKSPKLLKNRHMFIVSLRVVILSKYISSFNCGSCSFTRVDWRSYFNSFPGIVLDFLPQAFFPAIPSFHGETDSYNCLQSSILHPLWPEYHPCAS